MSLELGGPQGMLRYFHRDHWEDSMGTMVRIFARICGVSVLGFLAFAMGCGRFERPRIPNVIVVPTPGSEKTGNYTLDNYKTDMAAYIAATTGTVNNTEAMRLRNNMISGLMAEIDYAFYDYETKLFLNQGSFRVGSDLLQLGLAAAGGISNGSRSKTILSALLSGVTGSSLSVDKNFFRQQTVQAISSSMESNRDRIKALILTQEKQDVSTYPFQAARADLIHYFFAGTLPGGLQNLQQEAGVRAQDQRKQLENQMQAPVTADDIACATGVNQAVAKAFADNKLDQVIAFLQAMKVLDAGQSPTKDKIESSLRALGWNINTDATLRKQYCEEAKKAKLIQ